MTFSRGDAFEVVGDRIAPSAECERLYNRTIAITDLYYHAPFVIVREESVPGEHGQAGNLPQPLRQLEMPRRFFEVVTREGEMVPAHRA